MLPARSRIRRCSGCPCPGRADHPSTKRRPHGRLFALGLPNPHPANPRVCALLVQPFGRLRVLGPGLLRFGRIQVHACHGSYFTISRRRRGDGRIDPRLRLDHDPAWAHCGLAAEPENSRRHRAALPRAPGHAVGPRRHHDLQRCVFGLCRRPPPPAARLQGAGGLARGGRPQPPGHGGRPARGNTVFPRRAPGSLSLRPARGCVGRSRLQPSARRERQAGGRAGDRGRDDRAGARREGVARKRGAVPHLCRGHAQPRLGGNAGRQTRLVQSSGPRVHGRRPGELDGDRWGGVVHPDDLERAVAAWSKAVREGATYEIEFRLRNAAGLYRWHLARAMPIRDEAGKVVRWIGTNTDIDDQIRIEARAARPRSGSRARPADRQGRRRRSFPRRRFPQPPLAGVSGDPRLAAGSRRGNARGLGAAHPSRGPGTDRAAIPRRHQRRRARLQCRIPHHPPERWTGALDRGQGRDRARCRGPGLASGRRPHRHHRREDSPSWRCGKASSVSASCRKARP